VEFLIRLEDKINTQVWCYNPIHDGKKIVFEDITLKATCPDCKDTKYLYRKNDAITKKGYFIAYKPDGWSWGSNELKHYGVVKIDSTEAQAQEWCSGIQTPLSPNATEQERKEAQISNRPRKYIFDYEAVVPEDKDWGDPDKGSKIFELTDLTHIKDKSITEKDI